MSGAAAAVADMNGVEPFHLHHPKHNTLGDRIVKSAAVPVVAAAVVVHNSGDRTCFLEETRRVLEMASGQRSGYCCCMHEQSGSMVENE